MWSRPDCQGLEMTGSSWPALVGTCFPFSQVVTCSLMQSLVCESLNVLGKIFLLGCQLERDHLNEQRTPFRGRGNAERTRVTWEHSHHNREPPPQAQEWDDPEELQKQEAVNTGPRSVLPREVKSDTLALISVHSNEKLLGRGKALTGTATWSWREWSWYGLRSPRAARVTSRSHSAGTTASLRCACTETGRRGPAEPARPRQGGKGASVRKHCPVLPPPVLGDANHKALCFFLIYK